MTRLLQVKQGEQTALKVGGKTVDAIQVEGPGGTTRICGY